MNAPQTMRALALILFSCGTTLADDVPCVPDLPCVIDEAAASAPPSWVFRRSTFTHDPYTGARVAQYMRTPPVEPLDDERNFTSRYRRSRTNLRGHDGSVDTYYEVQAWGNGRGGIDAEWERFHDAWKESYLQGGFYNETPWIGGNPGIGFHGHPSGAHPGSGFHGYPGAGHSGFGFSGGHPGARFGNQFPGSRYGAPGWISGDPWYIFPSDDDTWLHEDLSRLHGRGHHGGGHHGGGHHGDSKSKHGHKD